jgi:hypothetical protein
LTRRTSVKIHIDGSEDCIFGDSGLIETEENPRQALHHQLIARQMRATILGYVSRLCPKMSAHPELLQILT